MDDKSFEDSSFEGSVSPDAQSEPSMSTRIGTLWVQTHTKQRCVAKVATETSSRLGVLTKRLIAAVETPSLYSHHV